MPRLDLRMHEGLGPAHHVSAGSGIGPRRTVQTVAQGGVHQLVVSRVIAHQIKTPAEAVMSLQLGGVAVGQITQFKVFGPADMGRKIMNLRSAPGAAFTRHGLDQRRIGGEQVVVDQLGRHILYTMGFPEMGLAHGFKS